MQPTSESVATTHPAGAARRLLRGLRIGGAAWVLFTTAALTGLPAPLRASSPRFQLLLALLAAALLLPALVATLGAVRGHPRRLMTAALALSVVSNTAMALTATPLVLGEFVHGVGLGLALLAVQRSLETAGVRRRSAIAGSAVVAGLIVAGLFGALWIGADAWWSAACYGAVTAVALWALERRPGRAESDMALRAG